MAATDAPTQILKITSSDGEMFEVERPLLRFANTINNMLESVETAGAEFTDVIPLNNVTGPTFKKVLEWTKYHKDDAAPEPEQENRERRTDDIIQWDQEFLKIDQSEIMLIILAANFLDIQPLLDTCCKTVANMIKGKSPEEIRTTFNIKNDFTPEEEEMIRKENQWCEE